MMKYIQIAIDGTSASGKSSVAKKLARKMGIHYLDTGATYRALTWFLLRRGMKEIHTFSKKPYLLETEVKAHFKQFHYSISEDCILVNGEDVTNEIRSPKVDKNVSVVSQIPFVRKSMIELQQKLAGEYSVVADGRDIGTAVLPDADFKFFISADVHERAKRRYLQNQEKQIECSLDELVEELKRRDDLDMNMESSPMRVLAPDVIKVDNTDMSLEETVDYLYDKIKWGLMKKKWK